jgi:hypothetical protein
LAQGTTRGVPIDTDPLLTADSDLLVPSQKAVKAYADTKGDMKLAFVQTNLGAKTFLDTTFLLRNVANTFNASFTNTNTADRIYTLPDTAGTIALTSNLTGYVPYTGATADLLMGIRRVGINSTDFGSGGHTFQLSVGGNIRATRIYSNIFRDEISGNTWVSVTGTAPNQVLALGNSSITSITNAQTWAGGAGVTYTALDINITDTSSAAGSMFLNLRTGGTSQLSISKFGQFTVANNPAIIHGSGVFTVVHGGVQHIRSSNSGTLIGTGGNATARLEVRSASAVSGTAFLVQNSTPGELFTIFNTGVIRLGTTQTGFYTSSTKGVSTSLGAGGLFLGYIHPTDNLPYPVVTIGRPTNTTNTLTSGAMNMLTVIGDFAPTSGTATWSWLNVEGTINQTGGANGTIRGVYYNPTITALVGTHNAWESTSGRIIATDTSISPYSFATTYAGAANSNNGSFWITSNGNLNNLMIHTPGGTGAYSTTSYSSIGFIVPHSSFGASLTVRVRSRYYDTSNATLEFSTNRGAVNPTFAGKFHGGMFAVGDFEYSAPTATIHGKGNSTTTGNVFQLQSSAPIDLFVVENSGKIGLKPSSWELWFGAIGNTSYSRMAAISTSTLGIYGVNNTQAIKFVAGVIANIIADNTSLYEFTHSGHATNDSTLRRVNILGLTNTFTPTAGDAILNHISIISTINQTGTASGIVRGLYIAPTLTAAANYRAIEAISRNSANDTLLKLSNNTRDVLCVKGDNKIGLFNATPTIQGTTAMAAATYTNNGSIDLDTFDGYTIGQVVVQLRNMGILS